MTLEKVKQIIQNSRYTPEQKTKLGSLANSSGSNVLTHFGAQISKVDTAAVIEDIIIFWSHFVEIYRKVKNGDSDLTGFLQIFQDISGGFNTEKKKLLLGLILDIKGFLLKSKVSNTDFDRLLSYEFSFIWELPKEELVFLLQNSLLFWVDKRSIVQDMQVIVYDRDLDYQDNFAKLFLDAIFANKEYLGKEVQKSVSEWIQEFSNFAPQPISQRNILQIGAFVTKNAFAIKLDAVSKRRLTEILKLVLWLYNPQINEDAILAYKEQIRSYEADLAEEQVSRQETISYTPTTGPSVVNNAVVGSKVDSGQPMSTVIKEEPVKSLPKTETVVPSNSIKGVFGKPDSSGEMMTVKSAPTTPMPARKEVVSSKPAPNTDLPSVKQDVVEHKQTPSQVIAEKENDLVSGPLSKEGANIQDIIAGNNRTAFQFPLKNIIADKPAQVSNAFEKLTGPQATKAPTQVQNQTPSGLVNRPAPRQDLIKPIASEESEVNQELEKLKNRTQNSIDQKLEQLRKRHE